MMSWLSGKREPGTREHFDASVLPHLDALYANAMRLTRVSSDAEDLVQETVLRAFRFHDRFEQGTNVKAWLLRIQYNAFVNHYRRGVKERDITESLAQEPAGEGVVSRQALRALTDPSGTALRPLVLREIEAALDSLPEEHRMVVVLADIEELKYREIAEVLGCPIGTVMSRLHRARQALRTLLIEHAAVEVKEPEAEAQAAAPVSLEAYKRDRRGG